MKMSVLEEEAMVLVEAIRFVSNKGWNNVIFLVGFMYSCEFSIVSM